MGGARGPNALSPFRSSIRARCVDGRPEARLRAGWKPMISMEELLSLLMHQGGSDLHISVGSPPRLRINGLVSVDHPPLDAETTRRLSTSSTRSRSPASTGSWSSIARLGSRARTVRVNTFHQRGAVACVLRAIPEGTPTFEQLGMPVELCRRLCNLLGARPIHRGHRVGQVDVAGCDDRSINETQ